MKLRTVMVALLAAAIVPAVTTAQTAASEGEEERIYLQEGPEWEENNWGFGIALGFVDVGDGLTANDTVFASDDVENYLAVNFRIPFGDKAAHRRSAAQGGFRGYLEPELGYWESDLSSDLLVGINVIGGMPFNAVEFFVGGGIGVHLIDLEPRTVDDVRIDGSSDEAFGVNAQFGVDVNVSQSVAFFAAGRFDIVDDNRDEFEGKAYVGLRFRW